MCVYTKNPAKLLDFLFLITPFKLLVIICLFVSCCYRYVKDTILESNSQPFMDKMEKLGSCYRYVKDTILESNSQHTKKMKCKVNVVIGMSKIRFLKAIHNRITRSCL